MGFSRFKGPGFSDHSEIFQSFIGFKDPPPVPASEKRVATVSDFLTVAPPPPGLALWLYIFAPRCRLNPGVI